MAKERLTLYDKYGNVIEYDISAASITIDAEGKQLDVKLTELADAIAATIKSVTFNGNSPSPDASGNVNLGQQMQADWNENNPEWPSYIRNKPTIPDGSTVRVDTQMSDSSDAPVANRVIKAYVDDLINGLINGAPEALDTLKELADALGDNDDAIASLTTLIKTKADKSTTYTKTETNDAIANAVEGLGGGSVESVSVNGGAPAQPDAQGNVNISVEVGSKGDNGITPHIDVVTGHWFIGDEDTGIPARGLQGNSGVASADGVIVVNNLTEGGTDAVVDGVTKVKVLSAEMGKQLGLQTIPDAGSFADAYEKARANNVVFPWFLRDVDENGNPIEKMIWHNGYRKFVDAIGAEVEGQRNGLTIKVNADCDMLLGSKTYPLTKGVNNFSFDDLQYDGSSTINGFDIRETGTTTSHGNYVEELDFGGLKLRINNNLCGDYDSLKKIKRLCTELYIIAAGSFDNCDELVEVQIKGVMASGTTGVSATPMLNKCPKLERADLKEFAVVISPQGPRVANFHGIASDCPRLKYADIRGFDTEQAEQFGNVFQYDSSLKTLIIGNLSNKTITTLPWTTFNGVTDCALICTTSEPPILKNCAFDNGVAQDEYDSALDWVAGHFSAIYVPTNAVTAYKTNTYVENGTEGNTGWSKYADIIHDIAGTEYEDLI